MGSTMHKNFSFYLHKCQIQVQKARIRHWLEWAPHSVSTISVLSMTYNTPVPLVRTCQAFSFVTFSFSFWVALSQLKHHPETTLKHWMWLLDPSDQKLPTLFSWPQVVPAPLFYHSDLVPTFAHYMSGPSGPIPNYTFCPFAFQHPLPPGPSGYTSYAASWFKLPTPPPLWRRQWWWLLELVHPGRQGKGIDQAPGGELAPE